MPEFKSFASMCMNFFGKKPGQTLSEFQAELKELTPKDKEDLIKDFEKIGMTLARQ